MAHHKAVAATVAVLALAHGASGHGFPSFDEFKQQYGKNYIGDEEAMRREIYDKNLESYAEWNAEDTATYGVDEYSDLATSEWKIAHGIIDIGASKPPHDGGPDQCNFENSSASVLDPATPATLLDGDIDWVAKGAVTPAKNQGSFGTCGYFSSVAVMEGISVIQGGNDLVSLSEQQIIDCCTPSTGCNGWPGEEIAYYAHHHVAAVTEASYRYKGSSKIPKPDGTSCKTGKATKATSSKRICIPNDSDKVLAHLKTLGPAVWMIDASCLNGYRGGIISSTRCEGSPGTWPDYSGINHATTLVGAGEEKGVQYWKVKNSWGTRFGENGYYRVKRDVAGTAKPLLSAVGAIFGVYGTFDIVV
jgi:cathepsin F